MIFKRSYESYESLILLLNRITKNQTSERLQWLNRGAENTKPELEFKSYAA